MRRTRRLAMAGEPAAKAQARPAPAGQDLLAGQAEARQARGQAHEGMAGKIARRLPGAGRSAASSP